MAQNEKDGHLVKFIDGIFHLEKKNALFRGLIFLIYYEKFQT